MSATTLSKTPIMRATECWVIPGQRSMIDMIHPETGLTLCYQRDAENVLTEYPAAVRMKYDDWRDGCAAEQDGEEGVWLETTKEQYWNALECVPPAIMAGGAFLLGEAQDHHFKTGQPRFSCYRETRDGKFVTFSKPITIAAFREMQSRRFAGSIV